MYSNTNLAVGATLISLAVASAMYFNYFPNPFATDDDATSEE